jgi:tRNA uridine 5-carboxymethylaminomethyl modification enzyme
MEKARHEREIQESYSGYIERERQSVMRMRRWEHVPLPGNMDFSAIPSLPIESRQKLQKIIPRTLGQAGRIPGVTPADVQILWVYAEKNRRQGYPAPKSGSTATGDLGRQKSAQKTADQPA